MQEYADKLKLKYELEGYVVTSFTTPHRIVLTATNQLGEETLQIEIEETAPNILTRTITQTISTRTTDIIKL